MTTATAAVDRVPAGAHVLATPSCATPLTLMRELGRRAAAAPGIVLASGLQNGDHPFVPAVRDGALRFCTWHVTGPVRDLVEDGVVEYIPLRASDVPAFVERWADVVLMRVSPPDRHGYCSMGPSASYTRAALAGAGLVLAEVDPTLPRTWGETAVHVSEIDVLVDTDTATPLYESAARTEESDRIAAHIIDLLPRGATVQVGIGAIPEAVAAGLAEADLGPMRVVGMGCEAHVELFEAGVLRAKDVVPDPAVNAVELMGTQRLLDFSDDNPSIAVIPSTRCHDPRWLGTLPRFVSINTAVEIDLFGQVGSETINGQVISGIGGSFDFFEGGHWSDGGLRILAIQSSTPNGKFSKIVARLAAGTPVSIPRHSVDAVVTEFGAVRLAGLSTRERAQALIGIAHPRYRDELADSVELCTDTTQERGAKNQ